MADLPAGLERRERGLDEVDRDAKPTPELWLGAAVGGDLVGDADDLAVGVEHRAAGVAGFIAASVWIACATVKPLGAWIVRSTPETMPVLMLRA